MGGLWGTEWSIQRTKVGIFRGCIMDIKKKKRCRGIDRQVLPMDEARKVEFLAKSTLGISNEMILIDEYATFLLLPQQTRLRKVRKEKN